MSNLVIGALLLILAVVVWQAFCSSGWHPDSIHDAPAGSFLAYGEDGRVEYQEYVADCDAEECAADRLCPGGGSVRVEHKFSDGSITIYTPETMRMNKKERIVQAVELFHELTQDILPRNGQVMAHLSDERAYEVGDISWRDGDRLLYR